MRTLVEVTTGFVARRIVDDDDRVNHPPRYVHRKDKTFYVDVDNPRAGSTDVFRQITVVWDTLCNDRSNHGRPLTVNVGWDRACDLTTVETVWFNRANVLEFFLMLVDWINVGIPHAIGRDALYDVFVHNDVSLSRFRSLARSARAREFHSRRFSPYICDELCPATVTGDRLLVSALNQAERRRRVNQLLPEWQDNVYWHADNFGYVHEQMWKGIRSNHTRIQTVGLNQQLLQAACVHSGNTLFTKRFNDKDAIDTAQEHAQAYSYLLSLLTAVHRAIYDTGELRDDPDAWYTSMNLNHQLWSGLTTFLTLDDDDRLAVLTEMADNAATYLRSEGLR